MKKSIVIFLVSCLGLILASSSYAFTTGETKVVKVSPVPAVPPSSTLNEDAIADKVVDKLTGKKGPITIMMADVKEATKTANDAAAKANEVAEKATKAMEDANNLINAVNSNTETMGKQTAAIGAIKEDIKAEVRKEGYNLGNQVYGNFKALYIVIAAMFIIIIILIVVFWCRGKK